MSDPLIYMGGNIWLLERPGHFRVHFRIVGTDAIFLKIVTKRVGDELGRPLAHALKLAGLPQPSIIEVGVLEIGEPPTIVNHDQNPAPAQELISSIAKHLSPPGTPFVTLVKMTRIYRTGIIYR